MRNLPNAYVTFIVALAVIMATFAFAQSSGEGTALSGGGAHVLRALVEKQGTEAQFDPQVTKLLGLTKEGQDLSLKQLGVRDDQEGVHAVNLLKPHGFLFVKINKNDSEVFQTDDEMKLLTALHKTGVGPFVAVPNIEAAASYLDELEFWATVASWAPEKK
jgi:hypothetical protein